MADGGCEGAGDQARQGRGAGAPARSTRCSLERRKRWLLGDDDAVGLRRCSSCSVQIACLQLTLTLGHPATIAAEVLYKYSKSFTNTARACVGAMHEATLMPCDAFQNQVLALTLEFCHAIQAHAELVRRHGRRGPCKRTSVSCAR